MRFRSMVWLSSALLCAFLINTQSAPSHETPEQLATLWIAAIQENDTAKIAPLIHPMCPKDLVPAHIVERMVGGDLPANYEIETKNLGDRAALEKLHTVVPEKQLTIRYLTETQEDREKFGLGKAFPIARHGGRWYFAICLNKT